MAFDMDTLRERIAERDTKKRGRKKIWTEPQPEDFAAGWVLAFDQTLTKTGWAVVTHNPTGSITALAPGLAIKHGGVLQPEQDEDLRSFEQTFAKAASMAAAIEQTIDSFRWVEAIVHEMPAVMGYRIESSLMAAREIRRLAAHPVYPTPIVMVSRQAAYGTMTGGSSVEKRQMTVAVERLIPKDQRQTDRWTQDVHDAAGLGLKYLYEKKRSQM